MSMASESWQLRVYSAGAVAPPLQKAIDVFENKFGISCKLTAGKPSNLLAAIAVSKEGDVISCGAEYILDEAEDRGLVVKGTRRSLGFRRSVIIVPPGNPAKITILNDLCREGVRIGIAVNAFELNVEYKTKALITLIEPTMRISWSKGSAVLLKLPNASSTSLNMLSVLTRLAQLRTCSMLLVAPVDTCLG